MNKTRRAAIAKIVEQIDALRDTLETLRDEEQDYFDNMPEGFQQADRGQEAEQAIDTIDNAIGELEAATSGLGEF